MRGVTCSAPGKLFLGGEYAVLYGAEAVVSAVNRRAVAFLSEGRVRDSVFVTAVREHVQAYMETRLGSSPCFPPIGVKSSGFHIDHHKLGLGSSAAVAAAAAGLLFELAGLTVPQHREVILRIASDAHRAAQGGKGSGADVATSVMGGTILFTTQGILTPLPGQEIRIVTVWSGASASTSEMIGQIQRFKKTAPNHHAACFDALREGAGELAEAWRRSAPKGIITASRRYARLMERLGRESGAPIITRELKSLINLAESFGGAAKPSGAGGGDIAVAFFDNDDAVSVFRTACIRRELRPLDIQVGAPGLMRDPDGAGFPN